MEKRMVPGKPAAPPASNDDTLHESVMKSSDEDAADFLLDDDATQKGDDTPPPSRPRQVLPKTAVMPPTPAAPTAAPVDNAAAGDAGPPPPSSQKTPVLGHYRLLKKLGQGGMGAVYKAQDTSLERDVAVKVMSKELASKPAFVHRFHREAKLMARLDHPNILRCLDVGETLGFHYLAMEYVDGGSAEHWLRKIGKLSVGDALHLTLAVARALQHAHDLNLVHRDIKPDNILLTKKGVVKVADLGLAKALDDDMSLTKTGTGAGTPVFMAPEQARDVKHVDGRVDIYALGCMLYAFLTGKPPFEAATLVELIEAKEKGKCTPVRQFNDDVPERLELIIEKMMAPKPEHRYQSCAEILVELDALGLAGPHLSFFPPEGPGTRPPAPPPPPKKITLHRTHTSSGATVATVEPANEEAYWYANLRAADGKLVTRKVTMAQLVGLVKHGAANAETPVSKSRTGGYRSLGTYPEFMHAVKARATTERADRKAEKFKALYEKIDKEERSRLRWRWLHNLYLRAGGMVGFCLWMAVVIGVLIGLFFLVRWGLSYFGASLPF
jgi:serine/threonine protein kinase